MSFDSFVLKIDTANYNSVGGKKISIGIDICFIHNHYFAMLYAVRFSNQTFRTHRWLYMFGQVLYFLNIPSSSHSGSGLL
ncbi:MAG: hypothetical protein H6R25_4494 [Proteobacteria bacterium]|nr:hypothetical protein [Pseudomonadota bacterium]